PSKITRSQTMDTSAILEAARQTTFQGDNLNILNLDLKMGHASADLSTLETKSIANLLNDRLETSIRHLEKLHSRVADTSSKVLVTGDLNSGKSTFVNALLKRAILPADQQPCTSIFCEVLDAMLNDGVEQVHAIPCVEKYNRLDPDTYHVIEMRHLYKVITEDFEQYKMLKIYANDARDSQESLLHNGVVDIALIDSPGLNTDSVKTTAVFARQEEIDVVVFVVSAENHFTLSGKEFLWNAANEKTHIFIVVNRFDSIRDKDRCKRLILEQIRQLSPATYADADDLVHFVSAGNVDLELGSRKLDAPDFARLEQRLRAFVLENRTKSKLLPAKNYLVNLLLDIQVLSEANKSKSTDDHARATKELEQDLPAYEHLLQVRDRVLEQVEKVAEATVSSIQRHAQNKLNQAVENIGHAIHTIEYPGILLIWQYAQDIADSMTQRLLKEIKQEESFARRETSACLERIHRMGTEHLGEYPLAADVNKLCVKPKELVITVEATDFFDLILDDKLSSAALLSGAATVVGGRMLGFKDAVSSICSVSNMVNSPNMRRWIAPVVGIASVGFIVYVVSDMRHAVERKLVKKFKNAARELGYIEVQSARIGRESRKVLRVEGWEIQNRIQRAIEEKEQKRHETEEFAQTSRETAEFFSSILEKSSSLLEKVKMVVTDPKESFAQI
ncbi:mitofusin, partial [Rhizopus azygosporus]